MFMAAKAHWWQEAELSGKKALFLPKQMVTAAKLLYIFSRYT